MGIDREIGAALEKAFVAAIGPIPVDGPAHRRRRQAERCRFWRSSPTSASGCTQPRGRQRRSRRRESPRHRWVGLATRGPTSSTSSVKDASLHWSSTPCHTSLTMKPVPRRLFVPAEPSRTDTGFAQRGGATPGVRVPRRWNSGRSGRGNRPTSRRWRCVTVATVADYRKGIPSGSSVDGRFILQENEHGGRRLIGCGRDGGDCGTAALPRVAKQSRGVRAVRCGRGPVPLLRRPFSVAWIEGASGLRRCPSGWGRKSSHALALGMTWMLLGPLGHGFSKPKGPQTVVCVAGRRLCALSRSARHGARAATSLWFRVRRRFRASTLERYQRGDTQVKVIEATDDRSHGVHGTVLDALSGVDLAGDFVAACGPNPMLAAIARSPLMANAQLELSIEAPMGCGFGTCLGCAVSAANEDSWLLCCTDGPVFGQIALDWDRLHATRAHPGMTATSVDLGARFRAIRLDWRRAPRVSGLSCSR